MFEHLLMEGCECAACRTKRTMPATGQDQKIYDAIADSYWKGERIADLERQLAEAQQKIDSFCMDYRIKCDEETKMLETKLAEVTRGVGDGLVSAFEKWGREKFIREAVNRFLGWKLPKDFAPDAGISFTPRYNVGTPYERDHEPVGTNLFTADQAKVMFEHCIQERKLIMPQVEEQLAAMTRERDSKIKECNEFWSRKHDQDYEIICAALAREQQLREALELARNGIQWYMDAHPEDESEADHEEVAKLDDALATKPDDSLQSR